MKHGLNIVAIRVQNESPVVARMVGTFARGAIVTATCA